MEAGRSRARSVTCIDGVWFRMADGIYAGQSQMSHKRRARLPRIPLLALCSVIILLAVMAKYASIRMVVLPTCGQRELVVDSQVQ